MSVNSINQRVQKYRNNLREQGLRPVQIWVADTRRPHFAKECRRQSCLVAKADHDDHALQNLMQQAAEELEGWTA